MDQSGVKPSPRDYFRLYDDANYFAGHWFFLQQVIDQDFYGKRALLRDFLSMTPRRIPEDRAWRLSVKRSLPMIWIWILDSHLPDTSTKCGR